MAGKRILLNFNYSRKQWVNLCEPLFLNNTIHWLSFINEKQDRFDHLEGHYYHYWSDFINSKELIKEIEPDILIIMDNLSPLTISLIFQAKKHSIPVFYLQHGVFSSYFDYVLLEKAQKRMDSSGDNVVERHGFSTLKFVKSSLESSFYRPKFIAYLLLLKMKGLRKAAFLIKDKIRIPDLYLCYDYQNATLHKQIDSIEDKKIQIIGNPEFEQFVKNYENNQAIQLNSNYWLLIDQAISGSDIGESFIEREVHLNIYKKLADEAHSRGVRLIVKLHPGDFNRKDFINHANIVFIKETDDLIGLVKGADHCFGFWSALLSTVVYFKPVTLIKFFNLSFYQKMKKFENVNVVDYDVKFSMSEATNAPKKEFHPSSDSKYATSLRNVVNTFHF